MELTPTGAVVVGLDPSAHARAALRWAAAEASSRDAVLRIALSWMSSSLDLPEPHPFYESAQARQAAHRFLDDAAAEARSAHPGLKTETVLLDVEPVEGLLHLASVADLVVVGSRGMNGFRAFLLGSVSEGVVSHTPVPAVVVPRQYEADADAPVVVGVAPGTPGPLDFAFTEAELRGVRLSVVRSWAHHAPVVGEITVAPADERGRDVQESAELERLLAPAREAHPRVGVDVHVGRAVPEQALVDASARACLVVVGAHHRHSRFGLPVGRVAHRVLHLSQAPVALVPSR